MIMAKNIYNICFFPSVLSLIPRFGFIAKFSTLLSSRIIPALILYRRQFPIQFSYPFRFIYNMNLVYFTPSLFLRKKERLKNDPISIVAFLYQLYWLEYFLWTKAFNSGQKSAASAMPADVVCAWPREEFNFWESSWWNSPQNPGDHTFIIQTRLLFREWKRVLFITTLEGGQWLGHRRANKDTEQGTSLVTTVTSGHSGNSLYQITSVI